MSDLYDEVAFFYFKYLGFTNFEQVDRLTLPEIKLQLKTFKEMHLEETEKIYALAYLTNVAGSTTKRGVAKYPTYKSFFDIDEAMKKVRGEDKQESKSIAQRVIEYRKRKGVV